MAKTLLGVLFIIMLVLASFGEVARAGGVSEQEVINLVKSMRPLLKEMVSYENRLADFNQKTFHTPGAVHLSLYDRVYIRGEEVRIVFGVTEDYLGGQSSSPGKSREMYLYLRKVVSGGQPPVLVISEKLFPDDITFYDFSLDPSELSKVGRGVASERIFDLAYEVFVTLKLGPMLGAP